MNNKLNPIAIYLPQFHPIPENDAWWGKGFTEWTNVAKAKPLFEGHYQPQLPADLGFYDLRLAETRKQQAALAREYGIGGFCYYHYWFNGKRVLERPFEEVFESGEPDFPFMLCWANENWTRTWDGQENDVLLKQEYNEEDDRNHIRSLIPYFKDERYIKVNGKPVFSVYKSELVPDMAKTIQIWREEAALHGMELYLCRFDNFRNFGIGHIKHGFDAAVEFQPFSEDLQQYYATHYLTSVSKNNFLRLKLAFYRLTGQHRKIEHLLSRFKEKVNERTIDYADFVNAYIANHRFNNGYTRFPGATPSWDNTARKGKNAFRIDNSTPEKFEEWLLYIQTHYRPASEQENFVFINAWNEWAEGNHLEPCQKWGSAYLEKVKNVFKY